MNKVKGLFQNPEKQGVGSPPAQQQQQQPPQYIQQQPQYMQQQPQYVQQRPQYVQQPPQYTQRPAQYGPSFSNNAYMPQYSGPPPNQPSYRNDMTAANLTGWSPADIERLRNEFSLYANSYGVIDREGFRKLYIASLLNMSWQDIERDSEAAFRNFDQNQTGALDFNEYIQGCMLLSGGGNPQSSYAY